MLLRPGLCPNPAGELIALLQTTIWIRRREEPPIKSLAMALTKQCWIIWDDGSKPTKQIARQWPDCATATAYFVLNVIILRRCIITARRYGKVRWTIGLLHGSLTVRHTRYLRQNGHIMSAQKCFVSLEARPIITNRMKTRNRYPECNLMAVITTNDDSRLPAMLQNAAVAFLRQLLNRPSALQTSTPCSGIDATSTQFVGRRTIRRVTTSSCSHSMQAYRGLVVLKQLILRCAPGFIVQYHVLPRQLIYGVLQAPAAVSALHVKLDDRRV